MGANPPAEECGRGTAHDGSLLIAEEATSLACWGFTNPSKPERMLPLLSYDLEIELVIALITHRIREAVHPTKTLWGSGQDPGCKLGMLDRS